MKQVLLGSVLALAAAMSATPPAGDAEFAAWADVSPLRTLPGALRPFAEQHGVAICPIPGSRDFYANGTLFCHRRLVHRFLRLEGGVPVYDAGTPAGVPSPDPAEKYVAADDTLRGVDGKRVKVVGIRPIFADLDEDGVVDCVTGRRDLHGAVPSFPWKGKNPWTGEESPYAGLGRGYDMFGRWLGPQGVAEFQWAKGRWTSDGEVAFERFRPILAETPDFPKLRAPLTWKMNGIVRGICLLVTEKGRWLVVSGDVNTLVALPLRTDGADVRCGKPRPLLASGYEMPHSYIVQSLRPLDLDGDGRMEILADGNPGAVSMFKGTEPGDFQSSLLWIEGGDVCGETLASPARYDWDGDGRPDLLLSDSSGWLRFWPGTDDPLVYGAPKPFTVDGKPFHIVAGDNGSIQGYNERCWGYVKTIAGPWGDSDAIVTADIRGDLLLHRPKRDDRLALETTPFTHPDGRPYHVAWRSRPDFIRAATGFAGVPRDALLLMDVDGDVAVAVPAADGATVLVETRKLRYAKGVTVRLSGPSGHWGRCHLALVDWDGDGALDIVFGSNTGVQQYFRKDIRASSGPFFLKNVGTNAKPAFARAEPFRLAKNGKRIWLGVHNATPWVTDLDGDGRPDLLVGAENGKVYHFRHDELVVQAEVKGSGASSDGPAGKK